MPAGRRAAAAWLDDDAWTDLPSTQFAGSVLAEVEHFTVIAGRWVTGAWEDCSFDPCGGDLRGTWSISGQCTTRDPYEAPVVDWCPGIEGRVEEVISSTVTYDPGGTWTGEQTLTVYGIGTFPQACVTATDGSSISITITGGPTLEAEYCVDGDRVYSHLPSANLVQVLTR